MEVEKPVPRIERIRRYPQASSLRKTGEEKRRGQCMVVWVGVGGWLGGGWGMSGGEGRMLEPWNCFLHQC